MADVTVIIPTFNRLWCLPRAIDSCRQTRCDTEIIVVDDGSSDGTWEWLERQPSVVAIRQPNQGQTWAINAGVARATGRYIRFLDSDDFLAPGFVDAQFEAAVSTGADVIYSRVDQYEQATGRVTSRPDPVWDDFLASQLGEGDGSHFLGMLFKRWLVERCPRRPDFAFREDRMFLLEVGLLEPRIAPVAGCCGFWVQHAGQMQGHYGGMKSVVANYQMLGIYQRILGQLDRQGGMTPRRRRAACGVLWRLAHWIACTHPDEASRVADWIHELDPGFRPPEPGILGAAYRHVGFRRTEQLLRLRRLCVAPVRQLMTRQPAAQASTATPGTAGAVDAALAPDRTT